MRTLKIVGYAPGVIFSKCVLTLFCALSLHALAGRAGTTPGGQGARRPPPGASIKTDRARHAPRELPTLPRAGGKFFDPVFGTEIMRVTDATSAPKGAGTNYSYWASFNVDNTKLLVMDAAAQQGATIYNFDPATFTLGTRLPPVPYSPPGNIPIRLDDACWSAKDPDALYVHQDLGTKIYKYQVSRQTFTLVGDVARVLPRGQYIQQMGMATDDDTFSFSKRGGAPAYKPLGYAVYRASTNSIRFQHSEVINEVRIDKSGRYLYVNTNETGAGKIEGRVVDTETGRVTDLTDDAPDHAPSHYDVGTGTVVGNGNYLVGISARNLAAPRKFTKIFDLSQEKNYGGFHLSMLADNEGWVLVSFYTTHPNGVMQGEVVQVATDDTGRVRRLFHHQAVGAGYYDSPRANISRDGRFVAFSSNWGVAGGRHDMFIARIDPAPSVGLKPTPEPPASRPRRVAAARPDARP
ncbi:MAG TPA: hypothetical protein VGW12_15145 [Pyrinomonadaceae bacterium]|nr:hypothetical protein [Pyrinomonadaceae bacterium]